MTEDSYCGHKSLWFRTSHGINFEGGSNLETDQTSDGYSVADFPYICTAYRIPPGSDVNLLVT